MADDPPERDVKDFQFQQLCKVRVSASPSSIPANRVQLLTSSSKFGLTFVATENGFKVLKTEDFSRQAQDHTVDRLQHVVTDFPVLALVTIGGTVSHITLSCDDLTLAVAVAQPDVSVLHFYDVRAFANQVTSNLTAFLTARLNGSPGSSLLDLAWNPAVPTLLVTCLSDGRLDMFEITDKLGMKANVPAANARCVCWSPKGKQLVAGREDGTLMQYDPDLKEKRKWDYPTIFSDDSYQAFDISWLSTYTFLVAYISKGADCSDQPQVILINGGKDTATTYASFDDVCYGSGEERQRKYFFSFIPKWDMVLAGSSNASEIGIIGKHYENKTTWEHWNLDDSARAECPLTDDYIDTFPMGVTVDFTSQTPIPRAENQTYPPSPLLLVLTTDGLIIPYYMIYSHKDTPVITAPKEQLTSTGMRKPTGQVSTETGTPSSQSGVQKLLPGAVQVFPGASQSEAKPPFGAGATTYSFKAPAAATSQGPSFAFSGTPGSASTSFTFKPEKNATSTPKSTLVVASADSTVPPAKPPSVAPNVNLFKPADTAAQPLNLGLGKGTTTSAAFQFGQPSDVTSSSAKPFAFGTLATDAAPTGFSALASASTTKPFGTQSISTPLSGFGLSASAAQKPFTFSTKTSSEPTIATTKSATTTVSGLAATSAPVTFGTSTNAPSAGAQKPKPALLGTPTTQPASLGPSVARTTVSNFGIKTGTTVSSGAGAKREISGEPGRTGFSGIGSVLGTAGAGAKPPPPSYMASTREPANPPQARGGSPVQAQPTDQDPSITASVDHSFSKSISEEIEHFQKEMQDLKTRASGSMFVVGEREEMVQLKRQTESIGDFWNQIRDTTQEQSKEVQDQRSLCLDMFAMAEECRSREQLNSDPRYSHLLKIQALDPGSLDKLQQLQLQYQVLDQGIKDVDLILDTQWEEYQQRKKNKTNRVQRPTNDSIYRIVKSNQNIIQAQKSKLKELEESLKQLKLVNQTSSWQPNTSTSIYDRSNEQTELSTLADSLVNPSIRPKAPVHSSTRISASTSYVNQGRLARLRDHLYRRHVPVVKSTRPENLSMSRLLVPDELLQQRTRDQLTEETAVKSDLPSHIEAPSVGTSGNFVGMQRRSTPASKQSGQSTTIGFNTNQSKEPGFTVDKQRGQGFTQTAAGTGVNGKVQGLGNVPVPKPPAGSVVTNRPMAAPSVRFDTRKPAGNFGGIMGAPAEVEGEITFEELAELQPNILTDIKELNGQTFEDITPEDSTENDEDENYDEDDEYDDDESNGVGFGLQYNLPPQTQGTSLTSSTPVVTRSNKSDASQTPVSRKLFSGDTDVKPVAGGFKFGTSNDVPGTFSFGQLSTPDASKTETKNDPAPSKPFVFAPASTKATTGFNFSMAAGLKTETEGSASGDSAAINSTGKEDRKSPVATETKLGGGGFNFGGNTDKAKSGSEVSSSDVKPVQPISSQPSGPSGTLSAPSVGAARTLSGLLESKSSLSLEELSEEKMASAATSKMSIASSSTVVTESPDQAEPSVSVLASTGDGDVTDVKAVSSSALKGLLGQTAASSLQSGDSGSQSHIGGVVSQPKSAEAADSTSSVGFFARPASETPSFEATSDSASTVNASDQATTTASAVSGEATTTSTVAFGQGSTTASGNLFGQPTAASSAGMFGQGTSASGSLFGQPTSAGAVLGGAVASTASSGGLFGTATATSSSGGLFGTSSTTASSGGLFGTPSTTASSGGLFGTSSTTASSGGLFGTPSATASSGGLFGTQSTTAASGGLFATPSTTSITANSGGLFGTPSTTASSGGLFGTPGTTASTGGLFATPSTTANSGGLFGTPSTTASTGGLFGAPSTTASSGGLFGTPSTTASSGGLFGTPSTTASSGGLFGTPSTTASSGGLFGTPSTTASSGGLFGTPSTTASSGGLFGAPSTTASSGGLFGSQPLGTSGTSSGVFGQPSDGAGQVFGQSSSSTTVPSGGFGAFGSPSGTGFGTATSGPGLGFGQGSPATAGFGGGGQSPAFGQTPRSGSSFSSTDLGGGSGMFSGLGGKPSAEKAGTNVFGTAQTFGSPSQEGSGLFGSGGAKAFGTAATSSSGGSFTGGGGGAFSGGGGGLGSTGFGGLSTGGSGFGSAPSFGGGPAFGGAAKFGAGSSFGGQPSFGSGAAFGSAPTFGNPAGGSTFGSSSPAATGGFASFASGSSPTFGALAQSTDVPTFGALNQAAGGDGGNVFGGGGFGSPSFGGQQQPQNPGFGGGSPFGTSPSFSGHRG